MPEQRSEPYHGIIGLFAHHKVAANLLMLAMLLAGVFALSKLNVQFFPTFSIDRVYISVDWPGATAEDARTGIIVPLEQRLKALEGLKEMDSTASEGHATIVLQYDEGTDMVVALDQVRGEVGAFQNFPADAKAPRIVNVTNYEDIATLLLTGGDGIASLRRLANRYEAELVAAGIDKVDIVNVPDREIAIELEANALTRLGLSFDALADRIRAFSLDTPSGEIAQADSALELRSLDQRRSAQAFRDLPVITETGARIALGDVAEVRASEADGDAYTTVNGEPAIEMLVLRAKSGNTLESARAFNEWLVEAREKVPEGTQLTVYDEAWTLIRDRITLLVKNGLGGLVLIILILYVFLSGRVAFWVMVGIPVSFMGTLFIMYLTGSSINMISLFALIMALGIIVDDAIVVGEDAQAHHQMGEHPLKAAEGGAKRMLAPVMASSLTTVAAFIPLMLVGDIIGSILIAIPLVIVTVILASLIESFLILPGHLRHAFVKQHALSPDSLRARLDRGFVHFRDHLFRPVMDLSLRFRASTIALAFSILLIALGLAAGGRLQFQFFPEPESQVLYANVLFVAGTPRSTVNDFLQRANETLREAEDALGGDLVELAVTRHGVASGDRGGQSSGDNIGSIKLSLTPPDERDVRNPEFIEAWRSRLVMPAGLDSFTVVQRAAGPPGQDIEVRLTGEDSATLKQASLALIDQLSVIQGVSNAIDDMPFGREQRVYRLTAAGEALGFTSAGIGRQLRGAFSDQPIQVFQDGADEVEVRLGLAASERERFDALERLMVTTPAGERVPLMTVTRWSSQQGFELLRQTDGELSVTVTADVDEVQANARAINDDLRANLLPHIARDYGVDFAFEGRDKDTGATLGDLGSGLILGLVLIYIILAWVFASYSWPFVVMAAIPFGLTGAMFGHWLLGIDLTILSLFGVFGLSGIVINDSIILVTFYKQLRAKGLGLHDALVTASCLRLRAIMLTSLTTIAGLTPLLFEKSLQAQFLIPMATSIAFGLGYATLLILFVIPAILSYVEDVRQFLNRAQHAPAEPSQIR
ncbi:MAG TPA: acriflavin resistance protein [Gammaproteobacteria bacterium]|jgi:multidrug efflux pump subunit AcrB|nr:acriflavin resistance protein [Gammaproteobacteria bacterium]